MKEYRFKETVESLFENADHVLSTKTVVGQPEYVGDATIIPLVDVSFGMGAGTIGKEKSDNAGGGIGGKLSPSAVLIIQNGMTRLVNVKDRDTLNRVIDFVPEAVNKVSSLIKSRGKGDEDIETVVNNELDAAAARTDLKEE